MEISAGVSLLLAGANVLVLSHPQSLCWLREFIAHMYSDESLKNYGLNRDADF
jgi:CO dehydrogenase/acetyl-CoA synthase delta subunit